MSVDGVLTTPELLHLIFCFSNKPSVAIGMEVCKFWAEVGKPVLWRVVDTDKQFVGLLRVLAPWDFETIEFERSLSGSLAWPRFLECSRLVHALEPGGDWNFYDPYTTIPNVDSVLDLISENRPISEVFPNLRSIDSIASDPQHTSILLHSGVRRWVIASISDEERDDLSIPLIPINPIQRFSGLVEIEIVYGVDWQMMPDELLVTLVALKELPCLATIILPYYTASYAVLEALSMCQTLKEIQTSDCRATLYSCYGEHSLRRPFRKGSFPVLAALTISGCTSMISQLLDDEYFPFHITSLAVEASVCSENSLSSAYSKIVEKCSRVTHLGLHDIFWDKSSSFSSLRCFLSYGLTRLSVDTYLPLAYEATEIEELARSLSEIEVLSLAPRPYNRNHPPFGTFAFNRLCLFARHCRKLTKFAVLVDTTQPCEPLMEDSVVPFAVLQELDLGETFADGILDDSIVDAAAKLLAGLLPTYCQVIFDCEDSPQFGPTINKTLSQARAAKERA